MSIDLEDEDGKPDGPAIDPAFLGELARLVPVLRQLGSDLTATAAAGSNHLPSVQASILWAAGVLEQAQVKCRERAEATERRRGHSVARFHERFAELAAREDAFEARVAAEVDRRLVAANATAAQVRASIVSEMDEDRDRHLARLRKGRRAFERTTARQRARVEAAERTVADVEALMAVAEAAHAAKVRQIRARDEALDRHIARKLRALDRLEHETLRMEAVAEIMAGKVADVARAEVASEAGIRTATAT